MEMDVGSQIGLMNVLSRRFGAATGGVLQEILMVMVVPMILQALGNITPVQAFWNVYKWITRKDFHRRLIKCTVSSEREHDDLDERESLDIQNKNHILQKAIRLYLQANRKNDAKVQEVGLYATKKVTLEKTMNRYGGETEAFTGSAAQLSSYEVVCMPTKSTEIQLGSVKDELVFEQYVEEDSPEKDSKKPYTCDLIYEVRASGRNAEEKVNEWIDKAFEWYRGQRKQDAVVERYMIQPCDKDTSNDRDSGMFGERTMTSSAGLNYKTYTLSSDKTFDCLFFPEKAELLELLDDFLQSRKKFNVQGFPKKLGLLLDGPPGTGKTSVIKALSAYTKRHVVSISLEKVKSNQQLMDIMFELVFPIKGHEDGGLRLHMDEIIFVMEDVDCASDVVYARKGAEKFRAAGQQLRDVGTLRHGAGGEGEEEGDSKSVTEMNIQRPELTRCQSWPSKKVALPGPLDLITRWKPGGIEESASPGKGSPSAAPPSWAGEARKLCVAAQVPYASLESLLQKWAEEHGIVTFQELAELLVENEEELPLKSMERKRVVKEASLVAANEESGAPEHDRPEEDAGDDDSESDSSDGSRKKGSKKKKGKSKWLKRLFRPSLTMAGLLNVLDGVVDSPGRILVMTTNHPEKLDPALIRPGRINQRLHLTYMKAEQVQQMVQYYMQQTMSPQQRRRLEEILQDRDITPAWVEQCCVEANSMQELMNIISM